MREIRKFLGVIIIILGILLGSYVGGWLMFIQPIISACTAFDAGLLTGLIVGMTILKCMFASLVGGIIAYIGIFVGGLLISFGDNSRYKKFTRKYRKN